MSVVQPYMAASLASDVYDIQDGNERALRRILANHPELAQSTAASKVLKADVGFRMINTRDNFCLCARGANEFKNDVFLIFRGTTSSNYGADWFTDARMGATRMDGELVHIGFEHAFMSVRDDLQRFIDQHAKQLVHIHCIGHSLGGAVATLAASWVKKHTGRAVRLYTFGAPKVGFLDAFSSNLTRNIGHQNIYRVYHNCDPVPMVPLYPFTHAPLPGYGCHISYGSHFISLGAHKVANYTRSVQTRGWRQLRVPPPISTNEQAVVRWLQQNVPVNPLSPQTWEWISAGLSYVLKMVRGAVALLQTGFVVGFTLLDKIAWLLYHGLKVTGVIDTVINPVMDTVVNPIMDTVVNPIVGTAANLIWLLVKKMMHAVKMKVLDKPEQLTESLMKTVLQRVMQHLNREAQQAISQTIAR